jgi:hypothetical protein
VTPEYQTTALAAGAGYAASALRLWIRLHARSVGARTRSRDRRETARGLPCGSRIVDEHDKITIEVGQRSPAGRKEGSSVIVGE